MSSRIEVADSGHSSGPFLVRPGVGYRPESAIQATTVPPYYFGL